VTKMYQTAWDSPSAQRAMLSLPSLQMWLRRHVQNILALWGAADCRAQQSVREPGEQHLTVSGPAAGKPAHVLYDMDADLALALQLSAAEAEAAERRAAGAADCSEILKAATTRVGRNPYRLRCPVTPGSASHLFMSHALWSAGRALVSSVCF